MNEKLVLYLQALLFIDTTRCDIVAWANIRLKSPHATADLTPGQLPSLSSGC